MAIGSLKLGGTRGVIGAKEVQVVTPKGQWLTCNSNMLAAQSAGELLSPATIATSTFAWVKVPTNVTKVLVRARFAINTTVITTSPVVRIVGGYDPSNLVGDDGVVPNTGTVQFLRLDTGTWAGTGVTCTCSVTTNVKDTSYFYSDLTSITGYNVLGADFVGVLVSTAGAITTGTVMEAQLLFL